MGNKMYVSGMVSAFLVFMSCLVLSNYDTGSLFTWLVGSGFSFLVSVVAAAVAFLWVLFGAYRWWALLVSALLAGAFLVAKLPLESALAGVAVLVTLIAGAVLTARSALQDN